MMMYNDNYYCQKQEDDLTQTVVAPTYSYNEPIGKEQRQHWNMMELDHREEECYAQYDLNMANVMAEADYQDYYCCYYNQQEQQQEEEGDYNDDDEEEDYCYQSSQKKTITTTTEGYDYQNDSLLSLVVGVQSYLTERQQAAGFNNNNSSTQHDSPLYNLQYKMYTYMRQRALELGVEEL